jgi:hypothetical protein
VILAAVMTAVAAVAAVIISFAPSPGPPGPAVAQATLSTGATSYMGVYENGPPQDYGPVAGFTKAADRQLDLVGYYSGWDEPFQTSFARTVSGHGAVTIMHWDPTDASTTDIAAGNYDRYLPSFAVTVRDSGKQVVIGFGHEMNATWYSWGYGQPAGRVRGRLAAHRATVPCSGGRQCHLAVDDQTPTCPAPGR